MFVCIKYLLKCCFQKWYKEIKEEVNFRSFELFFGPWNYVSMILRSKSVHCSLILRSEGNIAPWISGANLPCQFMEPLYFAPTIYRAMNTLLYKILDTYIKLRVNQKISFFLTLLFQKYMQTFWQFLGIKITSWTISLSHKSVHRQ